jgi:succinate-semialdehyde dehydrogenase/glutarate-semialdehyde dehydrogenase
MLLKSINPTTNVVIQEYQEFTMPEIDVHLANLHKAFLDWRNTDFTKRSYYIRQVAKTLRANVEIHAILMAQEMGKPIKEGLAEIEKCAVCCDFYADNAEKFLQPELVTTDAQKSFVTFQPLGVVLAVMPWNFPFWQVFRFAIPALMAGNVCALKHASNVSGCALAIENIFQQLDFPQQIFRTLLVSGQHVEAIIKNSHIAAVTLTGSTTAGQAVASAAGKVVKKTVLELGGSDAYVILDDADLELATTVCVAARLINSGQSCIAAKRFIVVSKQRDAFEKLFVKKMSAIKMGDPFDETNQIGPQARHDLRDVLHQQVQSSIAQGAQCLLGGVIPNNPGAFYPPTVLTNVKKGMPAYDEELFGPVAAIIPVKDEHEAIRVANDSDYGLGGAVFSQDIKKAETIAVNELQAGSVFVNAQVRSNPQLPFGGIKQSGYGRELSHYGIKEFVNIKTVAIY